jgi:hypothetical protein
MKAFLLSFAFIRFGFFAWIRLIEGFVVRGAVAQAALSDLYLL